MTRIIAGTFGGRTLKAPAGTTTRPTADRVREALFSSLGDRLVDAYVLDLFAGSGALGIEAVSRGAAHATLVEFDRRAAAAIRRNLEMLSLDEARAVVLEMTAEAFCRRAPRRAPFDVVLLDPPYALTLPALLSLVADLRDAGSLAGTATVVVERDRRDPDLAMEPPAFLVEERRRTYGDTVLLYFTTGFTTDLEASP